MPAIKTKIQAKSDEFKTNLEAFMPHVEKLNTLLEQIKEGGPKKARQRQKDQGKLLVRERIGKLVDQGDQFFNSHSLLDTNYMKMPFQPAALLLALVLSTGKSA